MNVPCGLAACLLTFTATSWAGIDTLDFDRDPFPGKAVAVIENPVSPWSFSIEPSGWLPSLAGDVGVRGLPASHIDYSPKELLQNLKWGAFLKAEARYGRWGLLGDGFFVDIEANGNLNGNLYRSAQVGVQQGLAQLALA